MKHIWWFWKFGRSCQGCRADFDSSRPRSRLVTVVHGARSRLVTVVHGARSRLVTVVHGQGSESEEMVQSELERSRAPNGWFSFTGFLRKRTCLSLSAPEPPKQWFSLMDSLRKCISLSLRAPELQMDDFLNRILEETDPFQPPELQMDLKFQSSKWI